MKLNSFGTWHQSDRYDISRGSEGTLISELSGWKGALPNQHTCIICVPYTYMRRCFHCFKGACIHTCFGVRFLHMHISVCKFSWREPRPLAERAPSIYPRPLMTQAKQNKERFIHRRATPSLTHMRANEID